MNTPPIPNNEPERLMALQRYQILDTPAEESFDSLTRIAAHICDTPIALVSLIDQHRQWFKSKVGLNTTETPRELAFCAHTICRPHECLVIPNALEDGRFATNPMVISEPNIRFYAGTPLVTQEGYALGTLCTIDRVPRDLNSQQLEALRSLGSQVICQLELRLQVNYLQKTQLQVIRNRQMSSLERLAAGVAHEINNPASFIHGNLEHLRDYTEDLLKLIEAYQRHYPDPPQILQEQIQEIDLNFLKQDVQKLLESAQNGSQRIRKTVLSLCKFSRLNEKGFKLTDIHESIENTLTVLQNRLKDANGKLNIKIIRNYSNLPLVDCHPGQLNQVFANLLENAIDALEECSMETKKIWIRTEYLCQSNGVSIHITDNGVGISEQDELHIFDPFFTTKSVGEGTGLGLSISHQIVKKTHRGKLYFTSVPGEGTEFVVKLPVSPDIEFN